MVGNTGNSTYENIQWKIITEQTADEYKAKCRKSSFISVFSSII